MSIFHPVPRTQLGSEFTHYGWFVGLVPVYVGDLDQVAPVVAERNGVPEWCFTLAEAAFGLFCWVSSMVSPDFEPSFPILITGEIQR
ncbi:hypothetical protein [Paracidovorax wautersii]|uniref:hypothetical protein n=1 Tax=Paracidovorax wautersii TaxID=1177982 RepID=UPI0031D92E32